ncbi:MAG: hypothetical protein QXM96_02605 [Candidatus Woesearchaeota archaeon]
MNVSDLKDRLFRRKSILYDLLFYEPEIENKTKNEDNDRNSIFEEILKNNFNVNKNNKFNRSNIFSLEEILSLLFSEKFNINIFKNKNLDEELKRKEFEEKIAKLNNTFFILDEEKLSNNKIFLYEFFPNTYYVYVKKIADKDKETKKGKEKENNVYASFGYFSLFVPTGVIVRSVPQSVLGNGVLGRAFIYQNYIEILDSLVGNEYIEVLTHEVLHIMYPEKKETEIRLMTRNYLGNTVYN